MKLELIDLKSGEILAKNECEVSLNTGDRVIIRPHAYDVLMKLYDYDYGW